MLLQATFLLLVLSLPGLLRRRGGAWLVRVCALLAMLGVTLALLDRSQQRVFSLPPRLTVVPTAAVDPELRQALQAAAGAEVELDIAAGPQHPADRLAGARLARRSAPDLALLYNGGAVEAGPRSDGAFAQVLALRPVLPLDPETVVVRSTAPAAIGRPAFFEVLLPVTATPRPSLRGLLQVFDPAGKLLREVRLHGAAVERVEWQPRVGGRHQVRLALTVGSGEPAIELRGFGVVEVAPPPPVTIVGSGAEGLAAALRVQGLAVEVAAALPAELRGSLLLLDPLDLPAQLRVRRFVEDGGGVFLVGGERGGALPPPSEPLGAIAPLVRLPLPPLARPAAGQGSGQPGKAGDEPPAADPAARPAADPSAAKGHTGAARRKLEEREVERRHIAMVLLVDRSGSMKDFVEARGADGRSMTKMDLAKASAMHTAAALDEGDQLAVISFGTTATLVLPLSPVQDRREIRRHLAGLQARDESTLVAAALDQARRILVETKAAVKHVVIITDGVISDAGDRSPRANAAARRFHSQKTGITLSLVQAVPLRSMPAGTATRAKQLAADGNGVDLAGADRFFFHVDSFDRVPRLLSAEVQSLRTRVGRSIDKNKLPDQDKDAGEKSAADTESAAPIQADATPDPLAGTIEVVAIEDSPLLLPTPEDGFPRLRGVLATAAHAESLTLLVAGPKGTPLLAFVNRGLGKLGVWSADFLGPWGAAFTADPAFPARLGQWIQFLAPARAVVHGVEVLRRPQVTPGVPLPAEVAALERLGGSPMRALDSLVAPSPSVASEVHGRAEADSLYAIVLLILLAVMEYLSWRQPVPNS